MARRKKRSTRHKDSTASPEPSTTRSAPRLPPADPPRRNLPLLLLSIALFAAWLIVLMILAFSRWPSPANP